MTPEEDPFIDGIAADPADEALRLVYSDWLEERGEDARAAYLRAEVANFRGTRLEFEWYEMPGVDQVWAHLISRWPVGILVPDLSFSESGPPITRAEIAEIEAHWGRPLMPAYAAFLLRYNGGRPSKPYLSSYYLHADGSKTYYLDEVRFFSTRDKDSKGRPYLMMHVVEMFDNHVQALENPFALLGCMPIGTIAYSEEDDRKNVLVLDMHPNPDADEYRIFELEYWENQGGLRRADDVHACPTFDVLLGYLLESSPTE